MLLTSGGWDGSQLVSDLYQKKEIGNVFRIGTKVGMNRVTVTCVYQLKFQNPTNFLEIKNKFSDFNQIYTDGPQDGGAVASATVFPSEIISR